jgi:hypothetical protein
MKVRQIAVLLAAIVGLAGASFASAAAVAISVNFNGAQTQGTYSTSTGPNVTGTAGAVPESNWNNAPGSVGGPSALVLNSGAGSGASLSYSSSNVYNAYPNTPPTSSQDYDLMQGYLDYFSGGSPINGNADFVTVTGLGTAFTSGGYKVLVYQNTDSIGSFGYSITDSSSITALAYGQQLTNEGANYPLSPDAFVGSTSTNPAGPATAANYVILTGFTGSSFTITGLTGTTGDGRARIAGFQIIAVPEPASIGLIGIGALSLLARRRRA